MGAPGTVRRRCIVNIAVIGVTGPDERAAALVDHVAPVDEEDRCESGRAGKQQCLAQ